MLYTPAALELALRCPIFFSSVGDEDKPETAESTLVRSDVSADMVEGRDLGILRREIEFDVSNDKFSMSPSFRTDDLKSLVDQARVEEQKGGSGKTTIECGVDGQQEGLVTLPHSLAMDGCTFDAPTVTG